MALVRIGMATAGCKLSVFVLTCMGTNPAGADGGPVHDIDQAVPEISRVSDGNGIEDLEVLLYPLPHEAVQRDGQAGRGKVGAGQLAFNFAAVVEQGEGRYSTIKRLVGLVPMSVSSA
jgi:hypothetical protein